MVNINEALEGMQRHPLESIKIASTHEDDLNKQSKLLKVVIADDDKKDKKESNSRITIIRISRTPVHKLNNVMFKKMLLKFITYFYEERMKNVEEYTFFGDFVYNALFKKYMMKKAAENRFVHLLSSCMKYRSIAKVRNFSRFLGLYDEFDEQDLSFYLDCFNYLQSSLSGPLAFNPEGSEVWMIPYTKCLDCLKYACKSIPSDYSNELKEDIEKLRKYDKNNPKGLIEADELLEKIVESFSKHKRSTRNFMHLIYEAADLNEDGYLQYREFELIVRFLCEKNIRSSDCQELFNSFCENFMAEDDEQVKAISFLNLCQLDSQHGIFSPNIIYEFTKSKNHEESLDHLMGIEPEIDEIIEEIRWRYSQDLIWEEHHEELNMLLMTISNKIHNKTNPEEVWLALRLIQEDSKRCIVHESLKDLMPKIGSAFIDYDELMTGK
ncbi:hypothetical protein SteCoe_21101 [Stentor coeruleus]|uniref:EF-hand domain-containing protein n=1 Tax=Stentor coeruleus TaxID=5963 RepID=A0A1R2BQG0_9CILI|nr:hypothetical protein SteCoe_21101 [Stentor coeruleus]